VDRSHLRREHRFDLVAGLDPSTLRIGPEAIRRDGLETVARPFATPSPSSTGRNRRATRNGFAVKHFNEQLVKDHGFGWGYTWTKLHLQWKGLVEKAPGKGPIAGSAGGGRCRG